jgi:hypothetical protein
MRIVLGAVLGAALALCGCSSGYEKFYQPAQQSTIGFLPFTGEPQIRNATGTPQETTFQMFRAGYALLGVSDFSGPAQDRAGAIAQAKKVGAAVIVISQRYQNTVSGALPITTPTSNTSYSSGTANIYGPGGMATGNYSGTTTTYGSQTTYVPYSIDRYEQTAAYFGPIPRRGFGTIVAPLTDMQRQQLGTNQAVLVLAVRDGSPAFLADILPGDYLFSIDGKSVYSRETVTQAFTQAAGRSTHVELMRNGQKVTKSINVPVADW